MKIRKSKAYLIVSSAYLGISEDLVRLFSRVANYYKAETFHLGPTISEKEMKSIEKIEKAISSSEAMAAVLEYSDSKSAENRIEQLEEKIQNLKSELGSIYALEAERVNILKDYFPKLSFVLAPDQFTTQVKSIKGVNFIDDGVELSKYMYLSAIEPSTIKTVNRPVNKNSMNSLKFMGGKHSWVVGHPVPSVETTSKPGLNEAHQYFTVGSLKHREVPRNRKEFYKIGHMPCAMLLIIDDITGEYHAKQLHVDYVKHMKLTKPAILDDGLVFFENKTMDVGSSDKATFTTDDHAPYQHPGTLGAFRQLNVLHKPSILINGGDAADFSSVCRHTIDQPGSRENLRLSNDLNSLRNLLDAQANVPSIKKKVLIDSNHHEWVTQEVKRNPYLKGTFDWKTLAKTHYPDWDVMIRGSGDNNIFTFGDYVVRHGDQESNLTDAERMHESGKYICGHWHRYKVYKRAITVGCGCGLGPEYIENRITSWISQITSMTKYNGVASVNPKIVLHNEADKTSRFAYRDKIYQCNYHYLPNN